MKEALQKWLNRNSRSKNFTLYTQLACVLNRYLHVGLSMNGRDFVKRVYVCPTAVIDKTAVMGDGTKVWHFVGAHTHL